ncbi:MAG TPA: hypothetical protein VE052_08365 [Gemmatimonadaceae bacterium]|nr:hypothetical protein [Gemmatimonadaceae bacterium]
MFIELLDQLRCINPHEATWLVASFKSVTNRFVMEGTLGCPNCSAEYPIRNGIADFTVGLEVPRPRREAERRTAIHDREELATRAGAFLNVTEPGATVVLGGAWADAALELSVMTEARVLAINPKAGAEESEAVGLLLVGSEIPVAPGSLLGVALDASFPAETVASAVRAVRAGGRIVGPVEIPPPSELAVLARDGDYWVAQKAPEVIKLSRAGR